MSSLSADNKITDLTNNDRIIMNDNNDNADTNDNASNQSVSEFYIDGNEDDDIGIIFHD